METSDQRGETLLEGIISMAILAVAIVGVLGAFGSSASLSARHRTATSADAVLYQFVEQVKSGTYAKGATPATVDRAMFVDVDGFDETVVSVRCWSGVGNDLTSTTGFPNCTTTNDRGLQAITLRVASADGQATVSTTVLKAER